MTHRIGPFEFGLHLKKEYSIKNQDDAIWEDFKDIKRYINKQHEQIESLIDEIEELKLNKKTSKVQKVEIVKFPVEEFFKIAKKYAFKETKNELTSEEKNDRQIRVR